MAHEYDFAQSLDEAKTRAAQFINVDPFPTIPRALLSSAEIYDYVRLTGMLHPFYSTSLKSASYEAHLGGKFIMWDENGNKEEKIIGRGESCKLPANSIAFVEVEPTFMLPHYIALRFNLRITHVHRGLLLGTGPLVDPGFEGNLLIPLHNLTATDYDIDTNKALIWIEFTKTTYGISPWEDYSSEPRENRLFPEENKNLTPEDYLYKANFGNAIRSSIPDIIRVSEQRAEDSARSAEDSKVSASRASTASERTKSQLFKLGAGSLAALVFALAAIVLLVVLDVRQVTTQLMSLTTPVMETLSVLSSETEII